MHTLAGELPDLFAFGDGSRVDSVQAWRRKRQEWYDLVIPIEYGGMPPLPEAVTSELLHPNVARRLAGKPRRFGYRLNIEGGARPFWFIVDALVPEGDGPFPVVMDGEIVSNGNKRTIWVDAKVNENPQVMRDIKDKFLRYYSVILGNYDVTKHFLSGNPRVIEVDATR